MHIKDSNTIKYSIYRDILSDIKYKFFYQEHTVCCIQLDSTICRTHVLVRYCTMLIAVMMYSQRVSYW